MGVLAGGEEGVGEFQGVKSYLWVASLRVGGDRRGAGSGSSERRRWRRACGPRRAAAWRRRRRHERAWKLVEHDGTWRAQASASREESILAVGWWKLWPRDGVRRRPEFRRNFNGDRWAGVSIPVGVGRGRARGWPTEVEGKVERLGARGIKARDGESWPAQRRRRGFAQLEPEEEEKGRKKKRRRPGRRG